MSCIPSPPLSIFLLKFFSLLFFTQNTHFYYQFKSEKEKLCCVGLLRV
ncbi:hypothetical protein BDA96_06G224000 [Sorghum bicolor]|uniref:Uncharacterized protein n=1 Tax=Sorghum bicolor TaxID=4558 RepID=A0A921QV61_SORBI|nr:hypothetical protein BDA96_06G224000 [Sorghum bicolor]